MSKSLFLLLTLATALVGCGSSGNASTGPINPITGKADTPTQMAAFAARSAFPTSEPLGTLRVAAIRAASGKTLKLYNFSPDTIPEGTLWINSQFARRVESLPSNGVMLISTAELYNQQGDTLADKQLEITRVQIEMGGKLYTVWGPGNE